MDDGAEMDCSYIPSASGSAHWNNEEFSFTNNELNMQMQNIKILLWEAARVTSSFQIITDDRNPCQLRVFIILAKF